ncbi:helix-turn-helix transcriptional regulator [Patulibacter sp. S7RM1-6]
MRPDDPAALGGFLRARRGLVDPADVGLPQVGRRRVPGLRREEVATLAGVSSHYYARLEQGRDHHPSDAVLEALARALRLDEHGRTHLQALAAPPAPSSSHRPPRPPRARPGLRTLLDAWSDQPAFVLGPLQEVVAGNALAAALSPGFRAGTNLMRFVFLEPVARQLYGDWDAVADDAVSGLRAAAAHDPGEPRLARLVGELADGSADFRRLWARHEVRGKTSGNKRFVHPTVGPLALSYESFAVNGAPGQTLVVYVAEPGSADAERLARLADLVRAAGTGAPAPA